MVPKGMRLAPALTIAFVTGCATGAGTFQPDGFHHADLPIVVRYHSPSSWGFVGPDWRVDNFLLDDTGKPGQAKTAKGYVEDRAIDYDGDGRADAQRDVPVYDLRLVNRRTDAAMWLQEIPLPERDKDRSLQVLLDDLVESISGTGFYSVPLGHRRSTVRANTFAARVVKSDAGQLGGFPSLDATIEVVNLDQQKVDPSAKAAVGRVILVRTAYAKWVFAGTPGDRSFRTSTVTVLGCESKAREFEATNADFARFVESVQLGRVPAK